MMYHNTDSRGYSFEKLMSHGKCQSNSVNAVLSSERAVINFSRGRRDTPESIYLPSLQLENLAMRT